jgi:heterodisulfide reductase subunit A
MAEAVVIGGGIAGITAALDIAGHGIRVHLVEREPSIGGHMAQLDKTFPTNDCSMCILSPKMVEVSRHPLVTIHTCSEVKSVSGQAGDFTVTIVKHPRYVNEADCNGCGDCVQICPVEVYNRFDAGIGVRKAIYKPHPQVVPDIVIRDTEHCIECGLCYDACGTGAVLREDEEKTVTVKAAAIVVTTGYRTFDPRVKEQLRYFDLPDVITSLELERMINASGPTGGRLARISDGTTPKSIVFIQCVGSRDVAIDRPYCSCVCCMYAMKAAMLIKEKYPDTEVTICYIDRRAYGKGYEEYLNRAESLGVRFLRGLPAEVCGSGGDMMVRVENTETGEMVTIHPDLVVLSVGMEPADDLSGLTQMLGLPVDTTGFLSIEDQKVAPVRTLVPGIYVAGTATAPRDIPDCVAQGGAAAMQVVRDVYKKAEAWSL